MNLIGLVGNNASFSHNRLLLKHIKNNLAGKNFNFEICEITDIPLFNADTMQNPPQAVLNLSEKIQNSDGVIIATPEYNHAITASLKNTLEWLSSVTHPFINKPILIIGASLGALGTVRAQINLRNILNSPGLNAKIYNGPEFLLTFAGQKFDSAGNLTDKDSTIFLENCVNGFLDFI